MTNLRLIKSESFGGVQADIYSNDKDMYMTALQLGECLDYANPRESINKIVSRNEYLRTEEFSSEVVLTSEAGERQTRVFTEDGIYEVTMLSRTDKAKEFRSWIRRILKGLRKGEVKLVPSKSLEIKEMNARVRMSNQFLKLSKVDTLSTEYKNILVSKATEVLTGTQLIPLPKSEQKTYSATELGDMFGITPQRIGAISNKHNLKTKEYGEWYRSKSQYSNKEVDTFVYYDSVIPALKNILG